jgi:hypothetical protein
MHTWETFTFASAGAHRNINNISDVGNAKRRPLRASLLLSGGAFVDLGRLEHLVTQRELSSLRVLRTRVTVSRSAPMDRKTMRTAKVALGAASCAVLCLSVVYLSYLSEGRSRVVKRSLLQVPTTTTAPTPMLRSASTKSLSQLGVTPEVTQDVLFFNRVPKAGSEMLVLLITWLQGRNNFRHYRLPGGRRGDDRRLATLKQVNSFFKI